MIDWSLGGSVQDAMEHLLLLAGLLGVIAGVLKWGYRIYHNMEHVVEFTVEQKKLNERLAEDLGGHIEMEEARDRERDIYFAELQANVREITREIRPNGGSSIKDVVNSTMSRVDHNTYRIDQMEREVHELKQKAG